MYGKAGPHAVRHCPDTEQRSIKEHPGRADRQHRDDLVERIDSIETTLAHIVPEFTANLLVPVVIEIYIFTIDWRMGLASLVTVPIGMFSYALMMLGSGDFYQHTIDATKALNDTAVEYINGIQVIKVFGKTKSSYDRFVHDAYEAAHSFIDWMRASILPMTFAMVVMPSTMVSVLPIGGLLVKNGSLETGNVPEKNDLELKDVHFSYHTDTDKEVLHGVSMKIPEGNFVALVGPSGSGKSTIARLIASLWDVTGGSISIGGM